MKTATALSAAVLILAACAPVTNLQMNDELTSLYSAQLGARSSDDIIIQQSIIEAFASLAGRAAMAAGKASTPEDAVSYYRIAATAAWQGGLNTVRDLSDSGWDICQRPDFDEKRRDCVMLLVIPDLAATDELTGKLDMEGSAATAERRKPAGEQSAALLDGIGDRTSVLLRGLEARFDVLDDARSRFPPGSVPPALLDQVHRNQDFIYCRVRDGLGVLTIAVGGSDRRSVEAKAAFTSMDNRHNRDSHVVCQAP